MSTLKIGFRVLSIAGAVALLWSNCPVKADGTTNSIPPSLYLTDKGHVIWYKSSGEMVFSKQAIKDAQDSQECRPAEQDPQGHWGKITDGFQLSIRFEKSTYAIGEPVVATILLRNVSDKPLAYLRAFTSNRPSPINVLASRDRKHFPTRREGEAFSVDAATEFTVFPRTQHKYQVRLNDYYDLTQNGEYLFWASLVRDATNERLNLSSDQVSITLTSTNNVGR